MDLYKQLKHVLRGFKGQRKRLCRDNWGLTKWFCSKGFVRKNYFINPHLFLHNRVFRPLKPQVHALIVYISLF